MATPAAATPGRVRSPRSARTWLPVAWSAVLAVLMFGPLWLHSGFALSYDMVAVPQQRLEPWMWGAAQSPPRAVPQDVFVAVLDNLVPGALLQRLLLTGMVMVAGLGMARLTRELGLAGQLVAISAYLWSPYVYQRLVIGHWGLLLAYAALPWALAIAREVRAGRPGASARLLLVVAAGTWVPTGGVLLVVLTAAVVLWPGSAQRWVRRVLLVLGLVVLQGTWLVPGALTASHGGVSTGAFGLDLGESPWLGVLSALTGGGIWSPRAQVPSHTGAVLVVVALLTLGLAVLGARRLWSVLGGPVVAALVLVAVGLLVWALLTATPTARGLVTWIEALPGGGLARDGQKWLALWSLLLALAMGAGAAVLGDRLSAAREARLLAYTVAVLPLVLLPDLVWGAHGRIWPVDYPAGWYQAAAALRAAPDEDLVVSLPWSAFRRYSWNDQRVVLDPAPRFLPRVVVGDTDLWIGSDGPTRVPGDDAVSQQVAIALHSDDPLLALRALGVGWLFVQEGQPGAPGAADVPDLTDAAQVVTTDGTVTLYRLTGSVDAPDSDGSAAIALAWALAAAVVMGAGTTRVRSRRHPAPRTGETTC